MGHICNSVKNFKKQLQKENTQKTPSRRLLVQVLVKLCKSLRRSGVSKKFIIGQIWGRKHPDQRFPQPPPPGHNTYLKQGVCLTHTDQDQTSSVAGLAGVCTMRNRCLGLLPGRQNYNGDDRQLKLSGNSPSSLKMFPILLLHIQLVFLLFL